MLDVSFVTGLFTLCACVHAQESFADAAEYLPHDPPLLPGHQHGARSNDSSSNAEISATPDESADHGSREFLTGTWFGHRTRLSERGIEVGASYTVDWSTVLGGGLSRRASSRHLWDFNISADLETLTGFKGASLFVDSYATQVNGGSADVGDLHGVSNIDSREDTAQIAEVWYEQWLFDESARFKIGKIDGNSEFAFLDYTASTLNASIAVPATGADMPTFPDPATGALFFLYPNDGIYIGAGLFDGATADGWRTGNRGPDTFFSDSKSDSWFMIAESGFTWDSLGRETGAGRFAIGVHLHTAETPRFDGTGDEASAGLYAIAEQRLSVMNPESENCERGFYLSLFAGFADGDIREVENQFGGGVSYVGLFNSRPDDRISFFASRLLTSEDSGLIEDETLFEFQYVLQATRWCHITPDVQYIINPGGDGVTEDAVNVGVRIEVSF